MMIMYYYLNKSLQLSDKQVMMKIAPPTRNRNKNSQLRSENGDGSLIDKIICFSSTPAELMATQVNKPAKVVLMLVMVRLEVIVKVMFPASLLASWVNLY